jgi:hypothetical protein
VLSTDPAVLRNMSAVRSTYTKGDFYSSGRIVPGVNNVVCERDEAKHKFMRAKMAPGVSQLYHHNALEIDTNSFLSILTKRMKVSASRQA